MINAFETAHIWTTLILVWVGTPVQVLFWAGYFTRKWRKYPFSRALMWKSGALALYLYSAWSKVIDKGLRDIDWSTWIDVQTPFINVLVFAAIVNQLRALLVEIAVGDLDSTETEVNNKSDQP